MITQYSFDGSAVTKSEIKGNGFVLWKYGETIMADGLFRMHDEQGFSLTDSVVECKRRGLVPCLNQFKMDAMASGWSQEKIDRVVTEAIFESR